MNLSEERLALLRSDLIQYPELVRDQDVLSAIDELQALRASQAKVVAALHDLNVAIDEMWNDVHRFQHWSAHQQLICAAQQAAATALTGCVLSSSQARRPMAGRREDERA